MKEKSFVSIVVYVRNEEKNIKEFLLKIDEEFKLNFEIFEYILVNDDSKDKTKDIIKEVSNELNGKVTVINLAWKHGTERAMISGIDFSIGDFVFEFDTISIDYSLKEIRNIFKECLKGFDIVVASPEKKLTLSSKLFYVYLKKVSHQSMELTTESFRVISRRAINRITKSKEKVRYRKACYHYSGFNTKILKYKVEIYNKEIKDLNFNEKIDFAFDILINYSNIATKISIYISMLFLFLTLFSFLYTIHSYITVDKIQSGWTTIMLFLSGSFTGIFIILAVISKYLTIIMKELQDKPRYVYRSVDKIDGQ